MNAFIFNLYLLIGIFLQLIIFYIKMNLFYSYIGNRALWRPIGRITDVLFKRNLSSDVPIMKMYTIAFVLRLNRNK